ncbi:DUF7808 domain-containing protein [Caenorhabditis elegans]|uniref:Secreted protein n=1 Tax=Caenorhabditis elegans TaxID=6239 RepID=O02122_CAEEL|nr:Secreted protein [Caenorhabditis elegans]CCD66767.1 Secreted protein [Caenorhabditis elegans]|eukprot:NP_500475.2 Uncharacterized protein CELE_W03D2.9 [Caenorhabditis elegans]
MTACLWILLVLTLSSKFCDAAFRYENRTLTCHVENGVDTCFLTAPDTKLQNLDLNINSLCRREPTDENSGNKKRIVCPIRCPKDYEVHVLNKIPSSNRKCTKYYTYGKFHDEHEWFIWMLEPCISTISTHCRFPDAVVKF